jgi:alpha-beta hydrolase superfamily lysophospholipase
MAEKCRLPSLNFREEFMEINHAKRNIGIWLPLEDIKIKAIVLISHGLGEHALCYYHIAEELVKRGYAVYGIDHVSHGKSEGRRGVIPSHETLVNDFIHFVNTIRQQYDHLPAFVLAHSMGTLVALKSIRSLNKISAMALSGPAIFAGHAASSPFGIKSLYPLSQTSFAVGLTAVTSTLDPAGPCAPVVIGEITSNPAVIADMKRDPRRNDSFVTNKTAKELIQLIRLVKEEIPLINLPVLCIHGEDDMIALKKSSEFIFEHIGTTTSEDKHLKIMKNLKHEVFNEPSPYGQECIMIVVDFIENEFLKTTVSVLSGSSGADVEIAVTNPSEGVDHVDIQIETEVDPTNSSSSVEMKTDSPLEKVDIVVAPVDTSSPNEIVAGNIATLPIEDIDTNKTSKESAVSSGKETVNDETVAMNADSAAALPPQAAVEVSSANK